MKAKGRSPPTFAHNEQKLEKGNIYKDIMKIEKR